MLPRFRDQLLHTKFASPQLRASAVARQRLDSYLAAVDRAPVTLIAAPAGFGKTTLVAAWAAQASERVAWLSLDDADNDPARFWVYLLTALEVARPGVAAPALGHLFQAQLPPIETTLTRLINDIDALPERLTLVLDDYHCISASEIHRGIAFLMNHQPAQLGLILLARADPPLPLNRLRARGQLLELRADDLRFTADEAAAFLNDRLRLGLAAPDVAALEARTEGWVAGLQLASLALRGQPDASRFVSSFTGSNRYVLSYLIDEVLARQPEEVQAYLLCTSILDRLCAELCDHLLALAQPPVDSSQAMLDQLYTAQLFLAALDDHGQWYRYHTLFADMLRHRLKQARPELLPALHVRASQWYEQRRYFHEAMRHAIAAGASELVATLTETHGGELLLQGEHATLARWLGAIPHDQLRAHPRLVALYARNQFALAQLGDVAERLAEAEAQLRAAASAHADGWEPEQHQLLGQLLGLRAYATRLGGDLALSIAQSHEALILLPADDLLQRSFVLQNLGSSYRWAGDPRAAGQAYADAAQLAERSEARSGAIKPLCLQGEMLEERGLLRDAQQHYLHARRLADEPPRADAASPVTSWAYVVLGRLWYEWNDLKQARQLFQEGLARASLGGDEDVLWRGYQGLALAALANHDQPASQAWLAETERLLQHTDIPRNQAWAGAFRAMLALRSGAVLAASRWAEAAGSAGRVAGIPQPGEPLNAINSLVPLTRLHITIVVPAQPPALVRARAELLQYRRTAESAGQSGIVLRIRLLLALAHAALGERDAALAELALALSQAEPQGYIRTFVDLGQPLQALLRQAAQRAPAWPYRDQLLAAFEPPAAQLAAEAAPPVATHAGAGQLRYTALPNPLSERELEVLRMVAAGFSNEQIARQLIVSPNTIKKHLANCFVKLDVSSRTAAVARARELALL